VRPVTIVSPWKDPQNDLTGDIESGHIVPAYWPTRMTYRIGVTENFSADARAGRRPVLLRPGAPVEEVAAGDGVVDRLHDVGGHHAAPPRRPAGTTFRNVFGVIVDKVPQVEGIDFTVTGGNGTPAVIHFTTPPAAGAVVRFAYFTVVAKQFPPAVHASTITKPGAVRGRNLPVFLGTGGARTRIGLVQSAEINATIEGAAEYELGTEGQVGRVQNGTDCSGSLTVRARSGLNFLGLLQKVTGVAAGEVIGYLNQNPIPLEIPIQNPKNPGQIIKTIYVPDAIFDIPGTPARVNTPVDFAMSFNSQTGRSASSRARSPSGF
jgi:hypothetical protein